MDCFVASLLAMTVNSVGVTAYSQIHHHIIALDRHRDRLRHVRSLHHARPRLDIGGIGFCAKPFGVAVGLAGADIEFPAVPGAADDFAWPGIFDLTGIGRLREPDQRPFAQRSTLMRAAVQQAEEFALDIEHRDRALIDGKEFARARRQLVDRSDDVTGHYDAKPYNVMTTRTASAHCSDKTLRGWCR